jgi:hypothetical protein
MVQGLAHRLHAFTIQAGSHRLDALAFTGQQEPSAVVL